MSIRATAFAAGLALIALVAFGGAATAGKQARSVTVKDPIDKNGPYYPNKIYAQCDVKLVKAAVSRRRLVIRVDFRGRLLGGASLNLHLNTRGGRKSLPEHTVDVDGSLQTYYGKVKPGGFRDYRYKPNQARVTLLNHNKSVRYELALAKIGNPRRTGFQVQTCGEGAVDIAPGGNYFNAGNNWDGTIRHVHAMIWTGR